MARDMERVRERKSELLEIEKVREDRKTTIYTHNAEVGSKMLCLNNSILTCSLSEDQSLS